MSIGYKKTSEMIMEEVDKIEKIDSAQKKVIADLCKKIYMLNDTSDSITGGRLTDTIMGEISLVADKLKEMGVDL